MNVRKLCLSVVVCLLCIEVAGAQYARQWAARFNGSEKKGNDVATAMAVDDSGYIYVAGSATRKSKGLDMVVHKYHADGALIWSAYYNGSGKGTDKAIAVAVDSGFSVYLTGPSQNASKGIDYATVKFDRNGNEVWAVRYNGDGNGEDQPVALAVNDSLNVYVTGYSMGSGSGFDYATVKYDRNGIQQWVQRYNGPANGDDKPAGMALRTIYDVYVTGASADTALDYCTVKYKASNGTQGWVARYNGPGNGNDVAKAIVLRSSIDVFITGASLGAGTGNDYCTIAYDSSGAVQWVSRYNGTANGNDEAVALGISGTTRVYVSGKSMQIGSFYDMTTVMYDMATGSESWASSYNGLGNDEDGAVAMVGGTNPLILGFSSGAGVGLDFALVQLKGNNGDENWSLRYNGLGNVDDVPAAVLSANNGYYVAGRTSPDGKTTDMMTIKFVDTDRLKYRTILQDSLKGKGLAFKTASVLPNYANVRDTAFARAFPKIKSGYANAPGGMALGNARPDSASRYGWIRITKGASIANFVPQTDSARGFDFFDGKPFLGEKKDPKVAKLNNKIAGELLALKLNIGASDAEVTPPGLGDLLYQLDDTIGGIPFMDKSLRQIASLTDNFLTYYARYPVIEWDSLYAILRSLNGAFTGPLAMVNQQPLVVTGIAPVDSVPILSAPAIPPSIEPLKFEPGSLDETPAEFALYQNYPNPFNPTTNFRFALASSGMVTLKVYDMLGREVSLVLDGQEFSEGEYDIPFDGSMLASGVYFYRLSAFGEDGSRQFTQVRRMILLK